jgi:hypothetical protein
MNDMSPALRVLLGLAVIACGVFPILAAFDVGPLHSSEINGPPWLGVVAGGIFVLGGFAVWAGDAMTRHPWIGTSIGTLVLAGLASLGNWIAFGAGPRECSGGVSGIITHEWQAGEIECRAAFGMGALMIDGMLVWGLGTWLRKRGLEGPFSTWIEKLGKGMLMIAIAPVILLLIAGLSGKAFFEAFLTFCRTGKWPRNEAFIARKKKETEGSH